MNGVWGQRPQRVQGGALALPRRAVPAAAGLEQKVLALVLVDRPVSTAMHALGRPALAVWVTHFADFRVPAADLALLAAAVAWQGRWRPGPGGRMVLSAALATLVGRAGADGLKLVFGRPWPETWIDANPSWIGGHVFGFFPLHGGRGYASFPSGHTVDIATPCAVLWRAAPRWRIVAAVLVVSGGAGLIASDFHFVSDVLAGLYLGVVVGYGVTALIAS